MSGWVLGELHCIPAWENIALGQGHPICSGVCEGWLGLRWEWLGRGHSMRIYPPEYEPAQFEEINLLKTYRFWLGLNPLPWVFPSHWISPIFWDIFLYQVMLVNMSWFWRYNGDSGRMTNIEVRVAGHCGTVQESIRPGIWAWPVWRDQSTEGLLVLIGIKSSSMSFSPVIGSVPFFKMYFSIKWRSWRCPDFEDMAYFHAIDVNRKQPLHYEFSTWEIDLPLLGKAGFAEMTLCRHICFSPVGFLIYPFLWLWQSKHTLCALFSWWIGAMRDQSEVMDKTLHFPHDYYIFRDTHKSMPATSDTFVTVAPQNLWNRF